MNPIEPDLKIFSEEHTPTLLAMQFDSVIRTARQRKRNVLQYLPIISKLCPHV